MVASQELLDLNGSIAPDFPLPHRVENPPEVMPPPALDLGASRDSSSNFLEECSSTKPAPPPLLDFLGMFGPNTQSCLLDEELPESLGIKQELLHLCDLDAVCLLVVITKGFLGVFLELLPLLLLLLLKSVDKALGFSIAAADVRADRGVTEHELGAGEPNTCELLGECLRFIMAVHRC